MTDGCDLEFSTITEARIVFPESRISIAYEFPHLHVPAPGIPFIQTSESEED
jgi:hypothetical protein